MLRRILLAATLVAVSQCRPVTAETPPIALDSPAPASLEAGETVGVTWSVAPDAADFDEMELVLSLDGGRTFPLRVTRRILASERGWSWTVPFVPTTRGRLALRAGSDERAGEERILAMSPEFAIARRSSVPAELLFRVGEEERTAAALDDPASARVPASTLAGRMEPTAPEEFVVLLARGPSSDSDADEDSATQASPAASGPVMVPARPPREARPSVRLPLRL
jgi:hypothetical protein